MTCEICDAQYGLKPYLVDGEKLNLCPTCIGVLGQNNQGFLRWKSWALLCGSFAAYVGGILFACHYAETQTRPNWTEESYEWVDTEVASRPIYYKEVVDYSIEYMKTAVAGQRMPDGLMTVLNFHTRHCLPEYSGKTATVERVRVILEHVKECRRDELDGKTELH